MTDLSTAASHPLIDYSDALDNVERPRKLDADLLALAKVSDPDDLHTLAIRLTHIQADIAEATRCLIAAAQMAQTAKDFRRE